MNRGNGAETHESAALRMLGAASDADRAHHWSAAAEGYRATIAEAALSSERGVVADAQRHLATVLNRIGNSTEARSACHESLALSESLGDRARTAEALNTLGCLYLESGELAEAEDAFTRATRLGPANPALQGELEHHLGTVARLRGDDAAARARFRRALIAFTAARDDRGRAAAFQSLGAVSAHQEQWADADRYQRRGLEVARSIANGNGHDHRAPPGDAVSRRPFEPQRAESLVTRVVIEAADGAHGS